VDVSISIVESLSFVFKRQTLDKDKFDKNSTVRQWSLNGVVVLKLQSLIILLA
jgi:hypothetical protein